MKHNNPIQKFAFLLTSLCLVALVLGGLRVPTAQAEVGFDLAVSLKAPLHVAPGSNPDINLSYSNVGIADSPVDTTIQVELPNGLSFVSAVDQDDNPLPPTSIDGNGGLLTWVVGALPAGTCCAHIWITTLVANDLLEETLLTTNAEISTNTQESNLDNNQASVTSQVCDMAGSQKISDLDQAKPGDIVTYTITLRLVSHRGHDDLRGRTLYFTDRLPPITQARFLGWVDQPTGIYDGEELHWLGKVGADEPVILRYRLGFEEDLPSGDRVINQARVQWSGGEMDLDPVTVLVTANDDEHWFGPDGGEWQHAWGLTLYVPPDSVNEMTRFQFRSQTEEPPQAPPGWKYAHRLFELTAFQSGEIHRFNQPLEITLRYNYGDIKGIYPNSLRLWYRAGPGEPWVMLGEPLQHQNGQITFSTDHFSEFALFGQEGFELMLPLIVR